MSPSLEVPAGMEIRRDAAIRLVEEMAREEMGRAVAAAQAGAMPTDAGRFYLWTDKRDSRLAVLGACVELLKRMSPLAVVVRGEADASEARR